MARVQFVAAFLFVAFVPFVGAESPRGHWLVQVPAVQAFHQ